MKKKILLGLVAAVMALAIGVVFGTVSHQNDTCFGENLEALSLEESNGGLVCYPIVVHGGTLVHNKVLCLNDSPDHCTYPHSFIVSGHKICHNLN